MKPNKAPKSDGFTAAWLGRYKVHITAITLIFSISEKLFSSEEIYTNPAMLSE